MTHSFDAEIATFIGLPEAIMLQHFEFWHLQNTKNKTHFYDGFYWTYNTIAAFAAIFPYLSEKQIRRILDDFEQKKIIVTGNYNKVKFDRTKWYALTELGISICTKGQMEYDKRANPFIQKDEPIPVVTTVITTDNNIISEIKNFTPQNILDADDLREKRKKVPQKKETKENEMKIYATHYDITYQAIFNGEPYIFMPKDFRALKTILGTLSAAFKKKYNLEPNEAELKYSLEFFLIEAAKDNWIRNNFTLTILNSQIQNIIHKIKNNHKNGSDNKQQSDIEQIKRVVNANEW